MMGFRALMGAAGAGGLAYAISLIASLPHDSGQAESNSFVQIDDTHFILAYSGPGDTGWLKTFSIDDTYIPTPIDAYEHSTACYHPSLAKIDDTHFMLAYKDSDGGYVKTFAIDSSHKILPTLYSSKHVNNYNQWNSLIQLDATHFALAYAGSGNDGYIQTFEVDGSSYAVTKLQLLEHDTTVGFYNCLIKIDATHFMLAYYGKVGSAGFFVKTFSVDASYNPAQIDSESFGTGLTYTPDPSFVRIDSTHFAVAYCSDGYSGFIDTFAIDGSYTISKIHSYKHDDSGATADNSLVKIDETHLALAYSGHGSDGWLKTVSVDGSYTVAPINAFEHDPDAGQYNSLLQIDVTHLILAYGTSAKGVVKTFSIE